MPEFSFYVQELHSAECTVRATNLEAAIAKFKDGDVSWGDCDFMECDRNVVSYAKINGRVFELPASIMEVTGEGIEMISEKEFKEGSSVNGFVE